MLPNLTSFFGLTVMVASFLVTLTNASWGAPSDNQYHIQTDEGPERFFRFQTDNGQFRKEKRLQDGTVIGTDAWIDASGYLRQKDYIADSQGYRILKSKTVFVGKGRPIQEAIKDAKKATATAGVLVSNTAQKTKLQQQSQKTKVPIGTTPAPVTPTLNRPHVVGLHQGIVQPNVQIRPHSQPLEATYLPADYSTTTSAPPSSQYIPQYVPSSTPAPIASSTLIPYLKNTIQQPSNSVLPPIPVSGDYYQPIAVYPPSSTPAPAHSHFGSPIAVYSPQDAPNAGQYQSTLSPYSIQSSSPLPFSNDLEPPHYGAYGQSSSTAQPYPISSTARPEYLNDHPVVPLFNRNAYQNSAQPNFYPQLNNALGNGYDQQFPLYDGVSTTKDGFRYYLPRQYHEEDSSDPQRRDGSFGYIDPFGIRRVIYYNASPEGGFVHRKNNRYVGFNATPYDPRPL